MRQTGRSSRIANFAIEQLFSVGQVIVTDHTVFEYPKVPQKSLMFLIDKIRRGIEINTQGHKTVSSKIKKLDDIYVIHFKLINVKGK